MMRCYRQNPISKKLQECAVVKTLKTSMKETQNTTVSASSSSDNWIYCFPRFITVSGKKLACPNYVFSLPSDVAFSSSETTYAPLVRKLTKNSILDMSLSAQFVHGAEMDDSVLVA